MNKNNGGANQARAQREFSLLVLSVIVLVVLTYTSDFFEEMIMQGSFGKQIPVVLALYLVGAIAVFGQRRSREYMSELNLRKKIEEELRKTNTELNLLLNSLPVATFCLDKDIQKVLYLSANIEKFTGFTVEEHTTTWHWWFERIHPQDKGQVEEGRKTLLQQGYGDIEYRWQVKDGSYKWLHDMAQTANEQSENCVVGVRHDITARKLVEDQLHFLTYHDPLTTLKNRTYLDNFTKVVNPSMFPLTLVVCDVNGLKLINDGLGHDAGDKLLKIAASTLKKVARKDDIVCRIGGDEFIFLLSNCDEIQAEKFRDRVNLAISTYNEAKNDLPLSIAIGFATCPQYDSEWFDRTFKIADDNMYREKVSNRQSSRNTVVQSLMKTLGARDLVTGEHVGRMSKIILAFGEKLNLTHQARLNLSLLAQFHDIGKVGIRDEILLKPGALSPEEFEEMKQHCDIGRRIAQAIPELVIISDLIFKHHERWDGKGYPLGLKDVDIPLECRILAVVDAYDAMTNDRPYRKAMPSEVAFGELKRCSGTQFDPDIVDKFCAFIETWQSKKEYGVRQSSS